MQLACFLLQETIWNMNSQGWREESPTRVVCILVAWVLTRGQFNLRCSCSVFQSLLASRTELSCNTCLEEGTSAYSFRATSGLHPGDQEVFSRAADPASSLWVLPAWNKEPPWTRTGCNPIKSALGTQNTISLDFLYWCGIYPCRTVSWGKEKGKGDL